MNLSIFTQTLLFTELIMLILLYQINYNQSSHNDAKLVANKTKLNKNKNFTGFKSESNLQHSNSIKRQNTNKFSLSSAAVIVNENASTVLIDSIENDNVIKENRSTVVTVQIPIKRHYTLTLAIIPLLTVFGNGLVIMAVYSKRSLQTVTNLLIVSLAVSDFLVAICVMSFAVYFEWNAFVWNLGPTLCNLYIGFDVACSTASILNLVAITLDRFIAIKFPLTYTQYGSNNTRALYSILVVWGVSFSVGLPVFFGANNIEQNKEEFCEFTNPYFIIISSILSFFLPCCLMIVLYVVIFQQLRARERARLLRYLRRSRKEPSSNLRHGSKHKTDGIRGALMTGAKWHCEMGTHFKTRADQMLMELSLQTSSFPTLTLSASSDDMHSVATRLNGGFTTQDSLNLNRDLSSSELLNHVPQLNSCPESASQTGLRRSNTVPLPATYLSDRKPSTQLSKSENDAHDSTFDSTMSVAPLVLIPTLFVPSCQDHSHRKNYVIETKRKCAKNNLNNVSTCESKRLIAFSVLQPLNEVNDTLSNKKTHVFIEKSTDNIKTNSFGTHLETFFPFIDSFSSSEELLDSCCREKSELPVICLYNNIPMPNSKIIASSLNFFSLEGEHIDHDQVNDKIRQVSSVVVTDNLTVQKQYSEDVKLLANNETIPNTSIIANYLSFSVVNTSLNILKKPKRRKLYITTKSATQNKLPNNILNKNEKTKKLEKYSYLNNNQLVSKKNSEKNSHCFSSAETIVLRNGWRQCCLALCCQKVFNYTAVNSKCSNNSSASPNSFCIENSLAVSKDYNSVVTTKFVNNNNKILNNSIDKNNNNTNQIYNEKKKTGFDRCLTCFARSLREFLNFFHVRYVPKPNVELRSSRQLVKKANKQMKREQKATVTLAIVLAVFLVCWVPFFTLHLTNAICMLTERKGCVHFLATFLSTWLGYLNSSLNPLIYTVFDQRFRKTFRNILKC